MSEPVGEVGPEEAIPVIDLDTRLLEAMSTSIRYAHERNPSCWSLYRVKSGTLVIAVEAVVVLSVYRDNSGDITLFGDPADTRFSTLDKNHVRSPFKRLSGLQVMNTPIEEFLRIRDEFEDEHFQALQSLAERVKTRTNWANRHQPSTLDDLSHALGRDLPRPAYEGKLGSSATGCIYSQQLDETLARSVLAAHAIAPGGWSLFPTNGKIALNVGQVTVGGSAHSNSYDFVVHRERLTAEQLVELEKFEPQSPPKDYPTLLFLRLPVDEQSVALTSLSDAHELALEVLTDPYKKATLWQNHNEDFRRQVEKSTGINLPSPAYINPGGDGTIKLEHVDGRRYWKVDSGKRGNLWEDMVRLGRIDHENWASEPVYLDRLPTNKEDFVRAIKKYRGINNGAAGHCWRFMHEMKPGDMVVAIQRGQSLGWSEITGDYEYVSDNGLPEHQRSAKWTELPPYRISNMSQGLGDALKWIGPVELTDAQFAEAIGASLIGYKSVEDASTESGTTVPIDPLTVVQGQFATTGLHYTDAQIATFYTSLQTKGFVVLSGISGTGKSKIATGFVEMLPDPTLKQSVAPKVDGLLSVTIKPYVRTYKRVILPIRQVDLLPPIPVGEQVEIDMTLGSVSGPGRMEHRLQPAGNSVNVLYFRGEIGKAIGALEVGTTLYVRPHLDSDSDKLEGIDLLRVEDLEPAERDSSQDDLSGKNHLFLSVRPDWRDSTSLLGYYNPLTQTYEWTEFLRFLLRARDSYNAEDGLAWFVILDEMNLAHVEYYFADLLSVIESGRDDNGVTKEALRIGFAEEIQNDPPPTEIRLPPNLYIIGTVNMDETTHAFSPKVLDRAFTIELADVSFDNYPISNADSVGVQLADGEKRALLTKFTRDSSFAQIDKPEIAEIVARYPRIRTDLQSLNLLLQQTRMHFGYRAFDEICQYLFNNDVNGMMTFEDAFDQAVLMKVLPKFSGSRARLQSPLLGVLTWAIDPRRTAREDVSAVTARFTAYVIGTAAENEVWTADPVFPAVARRVREMLVALERDGFVSFG